MVHFELLDLRLIVAVADSGSLSKAAAAFPLALSAASNRLRRFEEQAGLIVFTRHADGMTPTPAGRLVLDRARRILLESAQLADTIRDLTGQRRIALRLAGTTVANSTFLPAALGPFLADYPEVDLQLVERNSPDVLLAVQAGEVDIGVLDGTLATSAVVTLPFRHDRLVLVVPDGHPLAQAGSARLKDALGYPFVCLPPERAMQRFIEDMAARNARPLQIRVRAPAFDAIVQLVAQHAGIAMLPEAAAGRYLAELPVRQVLLLDPWATRELRICIRGWDELSLHGRQLLGYLTPGTAPPA
jgi:DNA-binding transcriptional LysR family regulator